MKQYLPFIFAGLGVLFMGLSVILRNGTADTAVVITNLASTFMFIGGIICFIGGIVTYFLRDNPEVW